MSKPVPLPPPRKDSDVSVEQAIQSRRSVRSFKDQRIDDQALSQILWAAQGLREEQHQRNTPSAGALYPLEIFTVSDDSISHYQPLTHSLVQVREGDHRPALAHAALDQEFIEQAPLTVIIAAVPERTIVRYGRERAPRYIDNDIGHAAQTLMLQAVAQNLGSVAVGAFHDDEVATILQLTKDTVPLYLVPVGYPG